MRARKDAPVFERYCEAAFLKRSDEELYDLALDLGRMRNVAAEDTYARSKRPLAARLDQRLLATAGSRSPAHLGIEPALRQAQAGTVSLMRLARSGRIVGSDLSWRNT